MKRITAMLLVLIMAFSLCACGSKDVGGTLATKDKSGAATPTPAAEETAEMPTEEPTEEPAQEKDVELGRQSGGVYENSFLGIGCALDENWTFASQEDMAEIVGITADNVGGDIAETMKNADVIYDMMAVADQGLVTITVMIENLGVIYGIVLDEEQYCEMCVGEVAKTLEPLGAEDVSSEIKTVEFAGAEHWAIVTNCSMEGVDCYMCQVCVKAGSYMGVVTMTSFIEDVTSQLAAAFYAVA